MLVVDASVLVVALADDGVDGIKARQRLGAAQRLIAPELVDLEVLSVLRRHTAHGSLSRRRANHAFADLVDLPLQRVSHRQLLPRCWQLRHNLTSYDAAYIALAKSFDTTLLTADARMASAPGIRCDIEVL